MGFISWWNSLFGVVLYGYDLRRWDFLGFVTVSFTYSESGEEKMDIALFVHKDGKRRSYKMLNGGKSQQSRFDKHPYVYKVLEPWRARDVNLYTPIQIPSEDLKSKLGARGYKWDHEKKVWKKEPFDIIKQDDSNVIELRPR